MDLTLLTAFMNAAEAGSFTGAGQRLGLTPSAIGKAIARLEERLQVRLFHRSTRSIALTPEGAQFLERCRRILTELRRQKPKSRKPEARRGDAFG